MTDDIIKARYSPAPGIELYHADSQLLLDELYLQGVEADLVLTDPPYGIAYQGAGHHRAIANDDKPPLWCVPQMARMLKKDKAMYVCTREDVSEWWRQAMRDAGLKVRTSIIWDKQHWTMGDSLSDYRRQTEMVLVAHTGRALFQPGWVDPRFTDGVEKVVKRDTCLWSIRVPRDRHSQLHPTPKPPEMMERAMLNHSARGELVLDPFMGGGSVGVAAVRQGRSYIGIELEADYFKLACENVDHALELQRRNMEEELA